MEINFVNLYKKNSSQSSNVFQNRTLACYTLMLPCNYIRLPLKRQHIRVFLKSVPLLRAIFFEHFL